MTLDKTFRSIIEEGAIIYGCPLSPDSLDHIEAYYHLILDWNERMNLVSGRDIERFAEYHILDSLKTASVFNYSSVETLMDFGSGAGLPGIPLSAAFPHLKVCLIESRLKRCRFLEECASQIPGLGIEVVRTRVEDLPRNYNKRFDAVISRATVKLDKYLELTKRFIRANGTLIAIKGDSIKKELSELTSSTKYRLFNISSTVPANFLSVRQGNIILIRNHKVINNHP